MSVNKTEKIQTKRYNHWFWNCKIISILECLLLKAANYLWQKQYNRPLGR